MFVTSQLSIKRTRKSVFKCKTKIEAMKLIDVHFVHLKAKAGKGQSERDHSATRHEAV